MSNGLLNKAWAVEGLGMSEKFVLIRLADAGGEKTLSCWPSLTRIAKDCCCSRATVIRAIATLEKSGHIKCIRRKGTSNKFHVQPVAPCNQLQIDTSCAVIPDQLHGDTTPVALCNPNPKGTQREPKDINARFEQFYSAYPRKEARGRAEKAFRAIMKSKDAPTVEQLIAGIERYKQTDTFKAGYVKMPATWLNDKSWLDQPIDKHASTPLDQPVKIDDGTEGWWTVYKGKMIRENKHEQRTIDTADEDDIKRYREKTGREPIQ
jgi:hypothetical protein